MATLNWIGKEAVVNHDKEVPFKLLEKVPSASVGKESKNLIIHGDNLEALKALMPFYSKKIEVIYIDPPYNTGEEKWKYNDKVNSPKIKEWLGKVVGSEGDDLTRHDKWLCMMYPRLRLLYELLASSGVFFVSIDDNEIQNLRLILDEIFGPQYFLGTITWVKRTKPVNSGKARLQLQQNVEYILVYSKIKKKDFPGFKLKVEGERKYNQVGKLGKCRFIEIEDSDRGLKKRETMKFPILGIRPGEGKRWKIGQKEIDKLISSGRVEIIGGKVKIAIYPQDEKVGIERPFWSHIPLEISGTAEDGKNELSNLLGKDHGFETVKPVDLIKEILGHFDTEITVLDSFAGSGTTGHAILDLNKDPKGNRKFILIEMEDNIAKKVTAERVKRAIKKYNYKDGFEYCELEKPLFNEKGQINEACSYDELASYIYFTETQTNLDKKKVKDPFVGESRSISYYLIYTGKNKNDLTRGALSKLKITGQAVIYADRCLVDEEELKAKGVVFKQIPYEIKAY